MKKLFIPIVATVTVIAVVCAIIIQKPDTEDSVSDSSVSQSDTELHAIAVETEDDTETLTEAEVTEKETTEEKTTEEKISELQKEAEYAAKLLKEDAPVIVTHLARTLHPDQKTLEENEKKLRALMREAGLNV